MPQLSPTMAHGRVRKWLKQNGDRVECHDLLFEVTTRELLMDDEGDDECGQKRMNLQVESQDEAFIARLLVDDDGIADVAIGEPIAILVEDECDIEDAALMAETVVKQYKQGHDIPILCWQAYLKQ
eukprot:CAMPEP_0185750352 /NCGR_PEP_ID=MMETSP1174-20130828/9127_1 /TAXON_ID=35687 /ORGANISM="Dictyocha speculum, Strain CCMP1381" /LENGTH=125 /DNA_ID=CAMNT_0028426877 /DNA_START=157 /DNA_END=534 /DNA_ORIENTATION=+